MTVAIEVIGGRRFIGRNAELEIAAICSRLNASLQPVRSATTKTGEINVCGNGREEVIYFLRQEGVASGNMRLVVRPSIGPDIDKKVLGLDGVSPHTVKRSDEDPRFLYNANFRKYMNKHDRGGDKEHYGWAFKIDISNGLTNLEDFLVQFSS